MTPELARVLGEAVMPDLSDMKLLKERIAEATAIVHAYIKPSPLRYSSWLSEELGVPVWLKLECLNPNGSFKVRGALSAIYKRLQLHDTSRGPLKVCAASAGNHAQGVALAARLMGCEAHIFLPKRTPLVKRAATERLGAKVYLVGDVLEEAFEAALQFAHREDAEFLHAFNDFDVVMGQATCAVEALEQFAEECPSVPFKDVDMVCCVGGGGLRQVWASLSKQQGQGEFSGLSRNFLIPLRAVCMKTEGCPLRRLAGARLPTGLPLGSLVTSISRF